MNELRHRTIWISDVHLGTSACKSKELLEFLRENDSDYLFLVGDIVDFWALNKTNKWPKEHNTIIQKILKKARHGTKVIFIPGNHDSPVRELCGMTFGDILIEYDYIYRLKDGRTLYIAHGDEFDIITKHHAWVAHFGDSAYTFLLWFNRYFQMIRKLFGLKNRFSLSQYLKYRVKEAVSFISDYEKSVSESAKLHGVDGVVCGHIHHAEIKQYDTLLYMNCGDWVESCTAIIETHDGKLELIKWVDGATSQSSV